ncbi:MAG: polymer-forming cytoskeletal protein [Clostridiaceae bacterium]|nr:polymer-forming cytoskeletal protein [Clostridiaceae bacterium]
MFSSIRARTITVDTLIGEGSYFEGNIQSEETIKIDGKIHGEIRAGGDIIIGEKAHIQGNIFGTNIIISGKVEGNVEARGQLRLTVSAQLIGDIKINSFIADEGAVFQGNCTMLEVPVSRENLSIEKGIAVD